MATAQAILSELKSKGSESTRAIYARHGLPPDRVFGVSVANLKLIAKKMKGDHKLACELYDSGNMDAMYLAGLVADGSQMTEKQLDAWAKAADGLQMISEYTVPGVAVASPHAFALASKWIKSKQESVAACGWCTYSRIVASAPDDELDQADIEERLNAIAKEIHTAKNRVRYTMNGFVIAVGTYVKPLLSSARATAQKIGKVSVDMGDTACEVPLATATIQKAEAAGKIGKKRKAAR
jgi:3-methyladenine DNA glycosylase AlkD